MTRRPREYPKVKQRGKFVDLPPLILIHRKTMPAVKFLEGYVARTTLKGLLIRNDHYCFEQWVPRCAVRKQGSGSIGPDAVEGDEGEVFVGEWYITRIKEGWGNRYKDKESNDES